MDRVNKVDISSGTILRTALILVGFWFLYIIADFLLMLFASVVIASAMKPVVDWLQQYKIPRAVSALLVYVLVLAVFSGVVSLMIPPLTEQLTQLAQALPQIAERFNLQGLVPANGSGDIVASFQQALLGAGDSLTNVGVNIFRRTRTLFSGVFTLIFMFVIALYLVVDKDAMKKPFRLLLPSRHLPHVEKVIDRIQRKIGRWAVAQLSLAVIIGVVVTVGLWLMGVQYPLVLGLLAGAFEVLPVIGPITAAVPAVIVGFSQSLLLGLGVLVFYILVQQAENHLLIPVIMRKATGLNPLITILAVLLGVRLAGIVGLMLAVPAAVVVSASLSNFIDGSGADEDLAG